MRTFLLFDLDGTLLRLGWGAPAVEPLRKAAKAALRARALSPPLGQMLPTLALLGQADPALRQLVLDLEDAAAGAATPCAGLIEALQGLAEHPTALVTTNGRPCALRALGRAGIPEDRFGALVCREDVTRLKPDPEPLLQAVAALSRRHGAPARVVMVGDAATDMAAAAALRGAAGYAVQAVGVLTGVGEEAALRAAGADVVLGSLAELRPGLLA